MKILLTASNTCTDPYPVYPLGMSVIAQALAAAGHDVKQFDVAVSGLGACRKRSVPFLRKPSAFPSAIWTRSTAARPDRISCVCPLRWRRLSGGRRMRR